MGLAIKVLMQEVKKFFFGEEKKTPLKQGVKKRKQPKEKQTQPEIQKREITIEIKPMSGNAFLKKMNLPPKKKKTRTKNKSLKNKEQIKKDNTKINNRIIQMEKDGAIISTLAKKGIVEFNKNRHLRNVRGGDIPKQIVREFKRAGIKGIKADRANLKVTVTPAAQVQLQKIQRSL